MLPLVSLVGIGGSRASMRSMLGASIMLAFLLGACDAGVNGADTARPTPTPEASTPSPSPTSSESPGIDLTRCQNPEGFAISYPEGWHTNSGDVVPPCSQFNPEPFEVPRGTDKRVAAITAWIDPVPFERASEPRDARNAQRREVVVDGGDALRLEYEVGRNSIWPEGTRITIYMIPLDTADGRAQTLFADTVALPPFDYDRNQEILDRMAATIQVTD